MMEESKVNNSTDQLKVFTSTVFILREQDGTRTRKDLKILNQRNFTTLSLFFTFLLYLLLQAETNQDKVVVTRLKQSLLT
jgi:hypothetical protein